MSHLRRRAADSYRVLRKQFTTPALILSIAAVVLALAGGAYAAGGGLSSKQKKEVATIAKKYATAGPEGKEGPPGIPGPAGATAGGVTSSTEGKGTNCAEGGSKFVAGASTTYACNGKEGAKGKAGKEGKEGSPWTAGGVLPPEKTETGTWTVWGSPAEGGYVWMPLSFPIPLPTPENPEEPAIKPENIHFLTVSEIHNNEQPEGCKEGTAAAPIALPGNLCIYQGFYESEGGTLIGALNPVVGHSGAATSGAMLMFTAVGNTTSGRQTGTFAVTAPAQE